MAATIERGGCVVCTAAGAAGSESRGSLAVRAHLRLLEGCLDPSVSKLQVGEDGRGEGGACHKRRFWGVRRLGLQTSRGCITFDCARRRTSDEDMQFYCFHLSPQLH